MLLLNLTKDEMVFFSDLSRTITPLIAAMSGAYLTYRFSKKDKIRDHLFTYKVKAYSSISEGILKLQKDIISLQNEIQYKSAKQFQALSILNEFNNLRSENRLFISNKINSELLIVEGTILQLLSKFDLHVTDPKKHTVKDVSTLCYQCFNKFEDLISNIQNDLEMHRIGSNNFKNKNNFFRRNYFNRFLKLFK